MDLGVFYEVIVPLMEVEGTATICISTPLGTFNFYSELTEIRDENGNLIFNVRHIDGSEVPSWKEEQARSRIQAIYGNRSTLLKREILGQIADDADNMAFSMDQLKRFFDKPPLTSPYEINDNVIYVCMDPNGGACASNAPGSDTAIISFFISQGRIVICGFETFPTTTPDQPRLILYKHLDGLRNQKCFEKCRFMLVLEANTGNEAQNVAKHCLRRFHDVDVLCQTSTAYGVFTSPGDPEKYVTRLQDKLAEDGIFYHNKIVCANPYATSKTAAQLYESTIKEFHRQLIAFRGIYIVPKNYNSRVSLVWTGKADKDGKRSNRTKDDMVMALLFGWYYATQYKSAHRLVEKRTTFYQLQLDPIHDGVMRDDINNTEDTFSIDTRKRKRKK